jgi:uncharacterized protein (DUF1330 family)
MSGTYIVVTYDITNAEGYKPYTPAVIPTLMAHNAEILVADHATTALEGSPPKSTIVLKFADHDAALGWVNSAEYQAIKHLRTDNSSGTMVIADEFVIPG